MGWPKGLAGKQINIERLDAVQAGEEGEELPGGGQPRGGLAGDGELAGSHRDNDVSHNGGIVAHQGSGEHSLGRQVKRGEHIPDVGQLWAKLLKVEAKGGPLRALLGLGLWGLMGVDDGARSREKQDYSDYLGPAEKSDSRYGRSFKQLLVLSQPILQSNLRSSARAKKELKGSAAGAQRSLPG